MPESEPSTEEIERKFLVSEVPEVARRVAGTSISQGYIAVGSDGTEVRLRRKGDRFVQTVKRGSGLRRLETEVELSRKQFDSLWPQTESRRVAKIRYEIPYGGHLIELDVFHGVLEGLIIAEVEFRSLAESAVFKPPGWFGKEVTEDAEYRNRSLAVDGRPDTRTRSFRGGHE